MCEIKNKGTKQNGRVELNYLEMHQGSEHFSIFRALSRRIHRHPLAAQGHLHIIHPTQPRSTRNPHPITDTLYSSILSTCSKPSQYLRFTLLADPYSIPALQRTSSFLIIIYHDFLPPPRRGSHVMSDNTNTQSSRYTN